MIGKLPLELTDLLGQFLVSSYNFTKLDKCPNNEDADLHGFWGIQHAGRHDSAMLRENERHGLGELEVLEVVAICDHLRFFFRSELEHEVVGKAIQIAPDLLVEAAGRYTVSLCEVGIYDHLLTANEQDSLLYCSDLDY